MKVRPAHEARESGYYWVLNGHEWIVAEWDSARSKWTITEYYDTMDDDQFPEIDERRIVRITT